MGVAKIQADIGTNEMHEDLLLTPTKFSMGDEDIKKTVAQHQKREQIHDDEHLTEHLTEMEDLLAKIEKLELTVENLKEELQTNQLFLKERDEQIERLKKKCLLYLFL